MKFARWFVGIGLASTLVAAHGQEVTLKVSHFLPPSSNFQKGVLEPWCEKLGKDSGGRLKCQIYPAMQLGGTPPQLVDQVKNGVADIVWTSPSYSTGRFPVIEAVELPFAVPAGGLASSCVMWEFYQGHAQKEFDAFKVLAIHSGSGVIMNTAGRPILGLGDFKGVKLRSPSRMASRMLIALGGSPVNMPPAQITEAVAKGVVDGAMAPWEVVPAVKLDEVAKYHAEPPAGEPGFTANALALLMNRQKYDGLPADLKAVIDRNSGLPLVEAAGASWDQATESARKKAEAVGNKVLAIKPADYAAMRQAAAVVEDEWVKESAAKGLDGAKLAAAAHSLAARHLK